MLHKSLIVAVCLALSAPAFASGGGAGSAPSAPSAPSVSEQDLKDAYIAGVKAVQAQDWKTAVKKFTFVTGYASNSADAWNYLGYSARKGGDPKKGEKAYKKALKLEPNHVRANEYYGELLLEQNRLPEAKERLAVMQACCATAPETVELAGLIADVDSGKPPQFKLKVSMAY